MSSHTIKGRISLFRPTPPPTTPVPAALSPTPGQVCQPNLFELYKGYVAVGTFDETQGVPSRFRRRCFSSFIRFLSVGSPRTCYPEAANITDHFPADGPTEETPLEDDSPTLDTLTSIVYQDVLPVLIALAILTNLMNVLMLWKVRVRQKQQKRQDMATTYCYLMWLAITDLLASTSLIPSLIHLDRSQLSYGWAFYYAHLEIPVMNALTSASVYIVVGMSVDRFVAVCFPRRYQSVSARRMAIFRIGLSLVVATLIYVPHSFYQRVVCNSSGMGWTYQGYEVLVESYAWHIWEVIVELCHRMVPATILVVLNVSIIVTFRKMMVQNKARAAAKKLTNDAKNEDTGRTRREKRLVYLLVAVVWTFLLTNLPAAGLALSDTAGATYGSLSYEIFRAVANCLEVLGFSLNFFLYFFFVNGMNEVFLEALQYFKNKLCCVASYAKVNNSSNSCSERIRGSPSRNNSEAVNL